MTPEKIDDRLSLIKSWLYGQFSNIAVHDIKPLTGDCSFRRYFRVRIANKPYIFMDAPPDKEPCEPFVAISTQFRKLGALTPQIYAQDINQGFLLLSDFGDELLLNVLNSTNVNNYYQQAMQEIHKIQQCTHVENYTLPRFDKTLYQKEFNLFIDWYLKGLLHAELTIDEGHKLQNTFNLLMESALSQPQVCVHRDFHSRNIMILSDQPMNFNLGLIDFQDAVWGPVCYDLVSLLRDCYIDWPNEQVEKWAWQFQKSLLKSGVLINDEPQQFMLWFDWLGLQRHLKCLGIFARMDLLYGKPQYLQYIPRVLKYVKMICEKYREFEGLGIMIEKIRSDA